MLNFGQVAPMWQFDDEFSGDKVWKHQQNSTLLFEDNSHGNELRAIS